MAEVLSFGGWLKRLRADRDLTQEALAEAVGRAAQTIRSFERGARRPSRDMADRLAELLEVPPEQRADFTRAARVLPSAAPASSFPVEQPAVTIDADIKPATAAPDRRPHETDGPMLAIEQAPLLVTTLYSPRLRPELVSRPRLLARLDAGLTRPLIMIAAPAGFRKTMLRAAWLAHGSEVARSRESHAPSQAWHAAWLALDAGDSDPSVFLRHLIAALQTIEPRVGGTALNLLRTAQMPPLKSLLPMLAALCWLPIWCCFLQEAYW